MERTIESLEHELKSEHDLYLRALADFDNYRRRIDRERAQLGREALRRFILQLLDVVDDFERFLNIVESETSPFVNGMRVVHGKFLRVLEAEGVRPFHSVGKPFDPSRHEAAGTAPAGEYPPGTVVEEIRRGYRWGASENELLRTARVVVAINGGHI
jgi:molecular chaperone GrpE